MARIPEVDPSQAEPRVRAVLEAQRQQWGAPLNNHLLYAHRPTIFHAARAMWSGIGASGLIPLPLQALVNRRVAALIGCQF